MTVMLLRFQVSGLAIWKSCKVMGVFFFFFFNQIYCYLPNLLAFSYSINNVKNDFSSEMF